MMASVVDAVNGKSVEEKLSLAYGDIRLFAKRIQEIQLQLRKESILNKSLAMENTVLRDEIDQLNDELEFKDRELMTKDTELQEELFAKEEYWNLQIKELEIKKKLAAYNGITVSVPVAAPKLPLNQQGAIQYSGTSSNSIAASAEVTPSNRNTAPPESPPNEEATENEPENTSSYHTTNINEFISNSISHIDSISDPSNMGYAPPAVLPGMHPLHVAMKQPEKFVHSSQFIAKYSPAPGRLPGSVPTAVGRGRTGSPTRSPAQDQSVLASSGGTVYSRTPSVRTQGSPSTGSKSNMYNVIEHLTTAHTIASKEKLQEKSIAEKKDAKGFKFNTAPHSTNKKFM